MEGPWNSASIAPPRTRRRHSARPFYLVLTVILVLATATLFIPSSINAGGSAKLSKIQRRWELEPAALLNDEHDRCRLVHKAQDKCAFVLANCDDHEVGLLSYLQLYYCRLPQTKPLAFVIIALWLSLLFSTIGIAASDFLCVNLSTIASILGMSESLTGVTFLAFGNGSPDVFSTFAAMSSNSGSLAIGELIGAAGFISAVVAGSMALVRPFRVARRSFVRDIAFFTCAATVSLVFIADGKLYIWECVLMIGFYIFYVVTVVTWHWYLGRQRQKRERDLMARAHFHIPQNQELDIQEVPEDEDAPMAAAQRSLLGPSEEDFNALERSEVPRWKVEDEDDDETRDRCLAELQGNMRVSRAPAGQRGAAMGPIRPSLVGALEFRSVLSSLRRSQSFQSGRIRLQRYSDDPGYPQTLPDTLNPPTPYVHGRARAVSANPPVRVHLHGTQQGGTASERASPIASRRLGYHSPTSAGRDHLLFASPTSSGYPSRSQSPLPGERSETPNFLAPPEGLFRPPNYHSERGDAHGRESPIPASPLSPHANPPNMTSTSGAWSTGSHSPTVSFPPYQDDDAASDRSRIPSVRLSLERRSAGSVCTSEQYIHSHHEERPLAWWPYRYMPPPYLLMSTLFPTLVGWREKSIWEQFLGITAAPSVFFLTITLPVVELPEAESEDEYIPVLASPLLLPSENPRIESPDLYPIDSIEGDTETRLDPPMLNGPQSDDNDSEDRRPKLLLQVHSCHRQDSEAPVLPAQLEQGPSVPKPWNRWLLTLQLITSPFFITLTAWVNLDSDMNGRNLLIPGLVSLLVSALLLTFLIFTTTPTTKQLPTRARPFVAFLGFLVSIAWISTLATEVVNVLKSIGVILSISDSLLGLTVFAVGNSLGDLVADVTVARLGYPVMALSACFGGPMLNILIGIGVGGLYMTLSPNQPSSTFSPTPSGLNALIARTISASREPYRISVSKSLLVSGAMLLATLLGLLIVVPLNGWRMDRKIGLGLVMLWCVSTLSNVIVEIFS
ncbi:hypothetical protein D8B26_008315 [Coccidioides posadasii str. Silveira]|uniref:Sodium/calcium exchanger protein n=2 Tax=Coccidioides posadasii TaxID=199306 RepID=E9DGV7_COCPS|nr:Sodium/calcium exchanger family protein [Coccidioides posadasii C735 delta SOWgp]EER25981.1 Sodium/calcium exchanger family protein [Coccidioides posadasii C735 delta SOWgp]EFW14468.1 sodium/calcium exchanger protein [Coccidioides posadasii str. Silveira]QVM13709.1 hypothetical protein D8B26_008315 [Coccidioides posadasii str. Silveira]|eukprot:XP_003068126.1 Sodium/calcium exchanger family protein [Coccidioides posadasii C735 delta SOWgp]